MTFVMSKDRSIFWVTLVIGACVIPTLYWFNKRSPVDEQYIVTNVGALFWLPMLAILLVLREEPTAFGFTPGDFRRGLLYGFLFFVVTVPALAIASRMSVFQQYYPLRSEAERDLASFGYFEVSYGIYLFCWEFFFRGFLLFGLRRVLGNWAVFAQSVAFGIMHLGKPAPEVVASFVAGVALGVLALRSRSFIPCFLVHWGSAVLFDILVIAGKPNGLF